MNGFVDPAKVLDELLLRSDMVAAEFGCGSGMFSLLLAKRLSEGKVYGLDVQEEPLSALRGRAQLEKAYNIETIRCDLEEEGGSTLPDEFLDLVLITNVLFQVKNREGVIREAERILKKGGRLLVVDWKKGSPLGPQGARVSPSEIKKMADETGMRLEKEFDAGSFHWGLVFERL